MLCYTLQTCLLLTSTVVALRRAAQLDTTEPVRGYSRCTPFSALRQNIAAEPSLTPTLGRPTSTGDGAAAPSSKISESSGRTVAVPAANTPLGAINTTAPEVSHRAHLHLLGYTQLTVYQQSELSSKPVPKPKPPPAPTGKESVQMGRDAID